MNSEILNYLENANFKILKDISLKPYVSFNSGGKCSFMAFPESIEDLKNLVIFCKEQNYPYFILGNGTNVLVADSGYNGLVISTLKLNKIELKGSLIICECGARLQNVIKEMVDNSFSGLEFAVSIPATVGGSVCMNAGAFSSTIGEKVCYVVTENGTYSGNECKFSYRSSRFLNSETILKVCFNMIPSESDIIEDKIRLYKSYRKNPKGNSCGSVFRNDGYFAGKIIDDLGFKGFSIGGATISKEHANFIINAGENSQDVYDLIQTIKKEAYNKKQIELLEEVIYLGEFK